jgi:hypothetical protein
MHFKPMLILSQPDQLALNSNIRDQFSGFVQMSRQVSAHDVIDQRKVRERSSAKEPSSFWRHACVG